MTQETLQASDFAPALREAAVAGRSRPSLSYWQDAWRRLRANRQALTSLWIIIGLLLFTLAGPSAWRVDPSEQLLGRISEPPTFGKQVVVLGELEAFDDLILPNIPDHPSAPEDGLRAPALLDFVGDPSVQAVRLRWTPVAGAAGYVIYRGEQEPTSHDTLGVPIFEVDGGNRVSYEDKFNLEPRRYFYSVVAKNGDESREHITRPVSLSPGIALAEAQAIRPDAAAGQTIRLPSRPFGTDYLGRDMLARLMAGARVSLFIGFFSPFFAILIGVILGGISGYLGGRADHYLMRFTDFVLALPFLLFMILFKLAFGIGPGESGIFPMLVAMIALSWTGSARLTRGQVLQLRESEFVQASRLLGARPWYLLLRHLIPNTLGVILVSLTFAIPSAIFTEAFLSFIGMGVAPPTPSWGSMCNDGIQTFLTHPHEFVFPAILISLTVLAFNLLGDGLRDALDPKLRSTQ